MGGEWRPWSRDGGGGLGWICESHSTTGRLDRTDSASLYCWGCRQGEFCGPLRPADRLACVVPEASLAAESASARGSRPVSGHIKQAESLPALFFCINAPRSRLGVRFRQPGINPGSGRNLSKKGRRGLSWVICAALTAPGTIPHRKPIKSSPRARAGQALHKDIICILVSYPERRNTPGFSHGDIRRRWLVFGTKVAKGSCSCI